MRVHFIAIGGSVMHQLAIALHKKKYTVTGSDDEVFEPAKSNLLKEGLLPKEEGWYPEKINKEIDAVILGMHAKEDNPELVKAKEIGLKIYSFPAYIYQESIHKTRVVVGGSHGKTTTTSMIMHVLKYANRDFDYMVGAKLKGFECSVNISDAPLIICEGDEYPASALEKVPKFHFLFPHVAILTGIAWDHINVFPTFDIYKEQFRIFIEKIESGGLLIYNETDTILKELVRDIDRKDIRYIPYGLPTNRVENGITTLVIGEEASQLEVFGNHNLLNIHAAYFVCKEIGLSDKIFVEGIASFTGASSRLEVISQTENSSVFKDFAHAPSKVVATISAVKHQFPNRKLFAIVELHTYSSLNETFLKEYAGVLDEADEAVVFYSEHALKIKRLPSLPKEKVIEGFGKLDLHVITDKESLLAYLNSRSYANTTILFMSSGNFDGFDVRTFATQITHS